MSSSENIWRWFSPQWLGLVGRSHRAAVCAAGSSISTGTRCQSSYQVHQQLRWLDCCRGSGRPAGVGVGVGGGGGGSSAPPFLPTVVVAMGRITRPHGFPDRIAESGQPAERLRRQHLSQQLLLPPLQTAGDGTSGSCRDMYVLPRPPMCSCCGAADSYERPFAQAIALLVARTQHSWRVRHARCSVTTAAAERRGTRLPCR